MGVEYAAEKLGIGIHSMATSAKPLQKRLWYAFSSFHTLEENDFPTSEMKEKWQATMEGLTSIRSGPKDRGYAQNTLDQMSDEEAERIAELIYDLNFEVRRHPSS